jgi:hypothetical protein
MSLAGSRVAGSARGARRPSLALLAAAAALAIALVAVVIVLLSSGGAATSRQERPFAASAVWNAPLPANAPLAADSSTLVSQLEAQVRAKGPWINTTSYSIPVYTVADDQATVPVTLDQHGPGSVGELASVLAAGVPIPRYAHAAAGTDKSLVIWQPGRDRLWEFWQARKVDGKWHAVWGGRMNNVSHNPGYFDDPHDWGGSATSLALLGGLMRVRELRSGHIGHALALAIPAAAKGRFVYPAQRGDGVDTGSSAIPEGTRFRLDPKLDVNALPLPPTTRMMALAAQRYGIIVRDQAGAVAFYAQDPTTTGSDPYGGTYGLFDGLSPHDLLKDFPWSHLEVVSPSWRSAP